MKVQTAQGPRSDRVHYVFDPHPESPQLREPAVCGQRAPKRFGWRVTNDDQNNHSIHGFCEQCLRRYVGPMH